MAVQKPQTVDSKDSIAAVTAAEDPSPYAIAVLRIRDYLSDAVKTEKTVHKTVAYTTSVISFTADGLKENALLAIPAGTRPPEGWPTVIIAHGYIPPDQYSTEQSYIQVVDYFAKNGFAVVKPDYRGHDQSEGDAGHLISRIDYGTDVLSLLHGLESQPYLDSKRVYLWGHSMGGDVTLRVLEITDKIKAASLWAPVSAPYPEAAFYFLRKLEPDKAERYEKEVSLLFKDADYPEISPISNLKYITTPIQIQHAKTDALVPYDWSINLTSKLVEENKKHVFYTYENDDHNLSKHGSQAMERDIDWFNSNK